MKDALPQTPYSEIKLKKEEVYTQASNLITTATKLLRRNPAFIDCLVAEYLAPKPEFREQMLKFGIWFMDDEASYVVRNTPFVPGDPKGRLFYLQEEQQLEIKRISHSDMRTEKVIILSGSFEGRDSSISYECQYQNPYRPTNRPNDFHHNSQLAVQKAQEVISGLKA